MWLFLLRGWHLEQGFPVAEADLELTVAQDGLLTHDDPLNLASRVLGL